MYQVYYMVTRKRRGGDVSKVLEKIFFTLKIVLNVIVSAVTVVPQQILHKFIYSKLGGIFRQFSSDFYQIKRSILSDLESQTAMFTELGIEKKKFIKAVHELLDFFELCLSKQSFLSIKIWFPLVVNLMMAAKLLTPEKTINPEMLARAKSFMVFPKKTAPVRQMDAFFQKEPVPNTNPSPSGQQLINMKNTLFRNLLENRPLLEGLFEPIDAESSMVDSVGKTITGPAISLLQTLIDEMLFLYVEDIGNLYSKVYSEHQALQDAILRLIDKGIYMACISQFVPIQPKEVDDLRKGGKFRKTRRIRKGSSKDSVQDKVSKDSVQGSSKDSVQGSSKYSVQDSSKDSVQDSSKDKRSDMFYVEGEIAAVLRLATPNLPKHLDLIVFLIRKL